MSEGRPERAIRLTETLRDLPSPAFRLGLRRTLAGVLPPPEVVKVEASKIGVLSDTHCRLADGSDLPSAVIEAFTGVDLIVHCGDLTTVAVLDRLEAVAPVLAVRGQNDERATDRRLRDGALVLEARGHRLGFCFELGSPLKQERLFRSRDDVGEFAEARFGVALDLIAFGATHRSLLNEVGDTTLLNPGSPTLPADGRPTVAILEISASGLACRLVPIRKERPI